MPVFLVERYVAESNAADLTDRVRRAADGSDVTWLASIVLPGEDACLCLFEAGSEADVVDVNRRAAADLDRVVEALLVFAQPPSEPESCVTASAINRAASSSESRSVFTTRS